MPPIPTASLCAAVKGRRTNSRLSLAPPRQPLASLPSVSLSHIHTHTFSLSL